MMGCLYDEPLVTEDLPFAHSFTVLVEAFVIDGSVRVKALPKPDLSSRFKGSDLHQIAIFAVPLPFTRKLPRLILPNSF